LLFSNTQIGILGKHSIPSELLTAKFNAIQLFVLNKNDMLNRMLYRCMFGLPEREEEMIDRLDSLCLVVDHQWSSITSLCRTREKTYQCISFLLKELPCRVSLVVHELLTLLEHLSSPEVFSGVRVTRCLVDCCLSYFCWSLYYLSLDLRNCIHILYACPKEGLGFQTSSMYVLVIFVVQWVKVKDNLLILVELLRFLRFLFIALMHCTICP
jgi:hypothetical protein